MRVVNLGHFLIVVLWISFVVLLIDISLVAFILRRRFGRWLYFRRRDAARERYCPAIARLIAGETPSTDFAAGLPSRLSIPARDAIRELLLEGLEGIGNKAVTDALLRVGYVANWAHEAFGRRRGNELLEHIVHQKKLSPGRKRAFRRIRSLRLFSIKRAQAVKVLASLDQPFAKVFMQEALFDPSPYVARANVSAMGVNPQEDKLAVLLELLRNAMHGSNDLAISPLKNALVRFPLRYLDQLVPFLDDADPAFRFALVDCLWQVCEADASSLDAAAFPPRLHKWLVEAAPQDPSVEVRARSARVIRHFHDAASVLSLRNLLRDENEFVRLHAARACADTFYFELIDDIVFCITDPRWRVREAAVKTLATFGDAGSSHISQYFLETEDRFAGEQIIEQMERSGIIVEMLHTLAGKKNEWQLTAEVVLKMARMGRTALLLDLLKTGIPIESAPPLHAGLYFAEERETIRERLLDLLLVAPPPELTAVLGSIAADANDPLSVRAQAMTESREIRATAEIEREIHA